MHASLASNSRQAHERGSALTWALLFVVITSGMIISHSIFLASNRKQMDVRFRQVSLATSFARSGAMDALGWFQKQGVQPVMSFAPQNDPTSSPPITDTIDASIGLVREFQVRGGLWGRYEVRKEQVADVSAERGLAPNSGQAWDIGAHGFLYELVDPSRPYNAAPNRIVATTNLRTEMRGITMAPPAQAAICVDDTTKVVIGPLAQIIGGRQPAIAYRTDGGGGGGLLGGLLGILSPSATVSGTPTTLEVSNYDSTPKKVFSMPLEDLRSMSDFVMTTDSDGLPTGATVAMPAHIADFKVIFIDGKLKLVNGKPFGGKLVLIVTGDVEVENTPFLVSGFMYVGGKLRMTGPASFTGAMVVGDELRLGESGTARVLIKYDPTILDLLRREVGRYRFARSFYADEDGR